MKGFFFRFENFIRIFKCIIYCLKVIGIAPFFLRIKTSAQKSSRVQIGFSKVGLCYNLVISILLPAAAAFVYQYALFMDYTNKSTLTMAADTSQSVFVICTSFIVLISWTLKQNKAISIINRLLDIDSRLSCSKMPPSHKKTLLFLLAHVILNNFLWVFLWASKSLITSVNVFPSSIFTLLPGILVCWYIVEYSTVIGIITAELESVNENLSNLKKIGNVSPIDSVLNSYLEAFSLPIYGQLAILQSIQSIRTTLVEISQEIDNFFSFPVLLCFAYSFSLIVSDVYYIITPVVAPNSTFSLIHVSSAVCWVFVTIYPIITLLYNITETLNEAKRTGQIVHKLLALCGNKEIKAKLEQFSLQLLHENLNFTACGFFTLDFTLLHTMLGSAATNLIILIQFQ